MLVQDPGADYPKHWVSLYLYIVDAMSRTKIFVDKPTLKSQLCETVDPSRTPPKP